MQDFGLKTFSVRLNPDDVEQFKKCYGDNLSRFIRASLKTVLKDGRESFDKIFFDNSLKCEVIK